MMNENMHTFGRMEVFGSEYDSTLYVMPEGMWEGRGGENTFAVIPHGLVRTEDKARLIAAAPDLLEVADDCRRILRWLEMRAGLNKTETAMLARAESAIARATQGDQTNGK